MKIDFFKNSKFLVFVLILGWVFSGRPAILSFAQEAASTSPATAAPTTPRWAELSHAKIKTDEQGEAKIDLENLPQPPQGAGELELYALPDRCLGATVEEIKRNILTYPYCGDPVGFAVFRPQDYSWPLNQDTRILLGYCESRDIDCGDHPERFHIIFISDIAKALPNQIQNIGIAALSL